MTAPTRFILLVIAVVCAAGALMVPGRDEWLAMMRDEDKQAQIIALLKPRLERNGNDIGILATLARSYAEIGNYRRAIELLDRYIALRSDDGEAYAKLADLYKSTGDTTSRIVSLKHSMSRSHRTCREPWNWQGVPRTATDRGAACCCRILKVS